MRQRVTCGSLGGVESLEVGLHVAAATDVGGDAVEGAAKLETLRKGRVMVARPVARRVEHVCAKKRVIVALITPLYSKRTRSVVREHILSFDYPLLHHSLGARLGIRSQALAEAGRRRRRRRRRRKVYSRRCRASLFLHYQGFASVDASLSRAHSTLALSYTVTKAEHV